MEKISFTGIRNIQVGVGKEIKKEYGLYPSVTGELKQGDKYYRDYKLRFNLTNDNEGADFDEFLSSMAKAEKGYTISYFEGKPNRIELLMRKYQVKDDICDVSYSLFKINGEEIQLSSRACLGLYTKLANITSRITKMTDVSDNQKKYVKLMNQSIAREAERFIELM